MEKSKRPEHDSGPTLGSLIFVCRSIVEEGLENFFISVGVSVLKSKL